MTKWLHAVAVGTFAGLLGAPAAHATQDQPETDRAQHDLSGLHGFDSMVGAWRTHHRKLKQRLVGSDEWLTFEGSYEFRLLMDGWANVSDNAFTIPGGASYRGVSLRSYDARTGEWTVWWLDGRDPSRNLDPPVKGRFADGVATFFSDDTLDGKPIRVRVRWSNLTATTARWEQAFSPDGGKSWETNWITDYSRAASAPADTGDAP